MANRLKHVGLILIFCEKGQVLPFSVIAETVENGEGSIRGALADLCDRDILQREQKRNDKGQIEGWFYKLNWANVPAKMKAILPDPENPDLDNTENSDLGRQIVENQSLYPDPENPDLENPDLDPKGKKTKKAYKKEKKLKPKKRSLFNNDTKKSGGDGLVKYIAETLQKFGFKNSPPFAQKIARRLFESELPNEHIPDFLSQQLYQLSVRIDAGDLPYKKALSYIGSTRSIRWYLEDKINRSVGGHSEKQRILTKNRDIDPLELLRDEFGIESREDFIEERKALSEFCHKKSVDEAFPALRWQNVPWKKDLNQSE